MKNLLLLPMLFVLFFVSTNIQAQNLILMGSEASCENGRVFKIVYNEPTTSIQLIQLVVARKNDIGSWTEGVYGTPTSMLIPPNTTEETFEYCAVFQSSEPPTQTQYEYRIKIHGQEDWVYFTL